MMKIEGNWSRMGMFLKPTHFLFIFIFFFFFCFCFERQPMHFQILHCPILYERVWFFFFISLVLLAISVSTLEQFILLNMRVVNFFGLQDSESLDEVRPYRTIHSIIRIHTVAFSPVNVFEIPKILGFDRVLLISNLACLLGILALMSTLLTF